MGKKIKDALRFINIKYKLTSAEEAFLVDLYDRRNQIAHQSDRIPGQQQKQPISKSYVEDFINKIESFVVNNLHPVIVAKN